MLAGGKSEGRADQELSFGSVSWNCLLDVKVEMVSRQLPRGGRAKKNTQYLWSSSRVPNSVCVLYTYIYSAHLHGTLIGIILLLHGGRTRAQEGKVVSPWPYHE